MGGTTNPTTVGHASVEVDSEFLTHYDDDDLHTVEVYISGGWGVEVTWSSTVTVGGAGGSPILQISGEVSDTKNYNWSIAYTSNVTAWLKAKKGSAP